MFKDDTVGDRIAKEAERHAQAAAELEQRSAIYRMLPEFLPAPSISNIQSGVKVLPLSWLTFRSNPPLHASHILAALESHGFEAVPASLVKWDNWRRTPEPGLCDSIPEEKGRYKLTEVDAIAPLWITPQQPNFGKPYATAFYQKEGQFFRVSVDVDGLAVGVSAERDEYRGGWRFRAGTARLSFPEPWHSIYDANGDCVAGVSHLSYATVETDQGLNAAIYFMPNVEQDEFPLTPAKMLSQLEGAA